MEAPEEAAADTFEWNHAAFAFVEVGQEVGKDSVLVASIGFEKSSGLSLGEGKSRSASAVVVGGKARGSRNGCADQVERGQFLRVGRKHAVWRGNRAENKSVGGVGFWLHTALLACFDWDRPPVETRRASLATRVPRAGPSALHL
jgi:hypothetical protein